MSNSLFTFSAPPLFWQKKGVISILLSPFSIIYKAVQQIDRKIKESTAYKANIPVISVGNITVGGVGKTPIVCKLAKYFTESGERVAILSRGYNGNIKNSHLVTNNDLAEDVGDEPKMMHEMGVAEQVWIGANRYISAQKAEKNGATLIILDDGFQHYKIKRNLDIVVIDGNFGLGNEYCIPAGPLREEKKALNRADIVIMTNKKVNNIKHNNIFILNKYLNKDDISNIKNDNVLVMCAIGIPSQFIQSLKNEGLNIISTKTFPDHHKFTEKELLKVISEAKNNKAKIVTTAKDFVKIPNNLKHHFNVVRLEIKDVQFNKIVNTAKSIINKLKKEQAN